MRPVKLHPLFFIGPYALLLYLVHGFYSHGQLNLYVDAKVNFIYTNFFLNHVQRGVYPFWNPFSNWGRPDDLLAHMMGEFNPFLYSIVLFQKLGMPFAMAYFGYLIIYFTIGLIGIYGLAKELFQDTFIAWLVWVSVIFSNLSGNMFNNILVLLIFVPSVWFFFFFIKFIKLPQKAYALGLVFCLMVILTTYMPFHFLVVLMAFLAISTCIYFRDVPAIIGRFLDFMAENKLFSLFCLSSLASSCIPELLWYKSNLAGQVVYGWRGLENALNMDIGMINSGNFIATHALINPISNLHDAELDNLYLPFAFFLIALLGMILPMTRRRILLFAMGLFFFLFTATNASPLLGFLYDHLFFIKYFRNPHFFVWALGVIAALLVMDIFQGLLELKHRQRRGLFIYILLFHLLALSCMNRFWQVNLSSYLTLLLSCLFFMAYFASLFKKGTVILMAFAGVLILLQPVEVAWVIDHKANSTLQFPYSMHPYSLKESLPRFHYLRPAFDTDFSGEPAGVVGRISDDSGFAKDHRQYQGTRWSLRALQNFSTDPGFQEYVRHKFVLYPPQEAPSIQNTVDFSGKMINGPTDEFQVTAFDMNYVKIRTAFKEDLLLVYNDSYLNGWKAFVNDRPVPLIKANLAFKGILVPSGSNEVLFSFHSPLFRGFYIALIFYFSLVLIVLLYLLKYAKRA